MIYPQSFKVGKVSPLACHAYKNPLLATGGIFARKVLFLGGGRAQVS